MVIPFPVLPLLVAIYLLVVHFGAHVPTKESLPAFMARGLHLELSLLTPIKLDSREAGPSCALHSSPSTCQIG